MPLFLIADDSEPKAMMLKTMVQKSGLCDNILIASTTEQAKEFITENADITFAFIDYEIPGEQGPAVIRFLKEQNPNAHIALVSSGDSDSYKKNASEAGAERYICTSYTSDEVERRIMDVLEEWKIAG